MLTSIASTQGVGLANEDTAYASPTCVVVLDGLSAPKDLPMGCFHGTPWYVRQLGSRLVSLGADTSLPLVEALRHGISEVNSLHSNVCKLEEGAVPASTVVMIRERDDDLDYLVLSDSALLMKLDNGETQTVVDKRVEEVAQEAMTTALQEPVGTAAHAEAVSRLVSAQRRLRNTPAGYWIASTAPNAADYAITGTLPLARIHEAALMTDGASRLIDFGVLTPDHLFELLHAEGPLGLITRTREVEAEDSAGTRWPRFKISDDATAAYIQFSSDEPP